MVSKKLKDAIRLCEERQYQIAHKAGVHPSIVSSILCGIVKVKRGDQRVIALGKVMGIEAHDCFENKQETAA